MVCLESPSFDPYFNLALEEYLFEKYPKTGTYFMLWQNDNAVIVGRYQNTAREVNEAYIRERGVRVVRRLSGGGAVYHDLGNLNFTIITDAAESRLIDFRLFISPVLSMLKALGVPAEARGRNDITVEGAKFSGNAQYIKDKRVMHHGTILFDTDLSAAAQALTPPQDKFTGKAVQSVRSRVTNLKPYLPGLSLGEFKEIFIGEMAKTGHLERREFSPHDEDEARSLAARRYSLWDWNYGRSPAYQRHKGRRFDGAGKIELDYSVKEGRIEAYEISGDFFGDGDSPELRERLLGCKLERGALKQALEKAELARLFGGVSLDDFLTLFE
jgi:lipoate-protein ligase A